ncbi:hypothetical protein JKP88DRAFT_273851 [Tribonema minus]|uniref:Uncharacterized protein n=1 Tax=Tribonema minus TaxID=303371 RepID=A0A836CAH6_9STRA|nr:hypothetical protein JKP88DRAFT_273851 [Tribonema minus]
MSKMDALCDAAYYHRDRAEQNALKTLSTTKLGHTITRDGGLPPLVGTITVDASEGLEVLARQVAAHTGVTMDRQLWLRIDSLARRAILHLKHWHSKTTDQRSTELRSGFPEGKSGLAAGQSKQTEMTQYTV